jgi:spermidine synthase
VLSAASGCAALIYELVWFQTLELFIGSSAVSVATLLAAFMSGLGAGSVFVPRHISPGRHAIVVYGVLELAIGVCGLVLLAVLPLVGGVYAASGGAGGVATRAVVAALCLLPPTIVMGATLPIAARWADRRPSTSAGWVGLMYAANTIGAVAGALIAGFYLLRLFDAKTTTLVAVAINLAVGALAFVLAAFSPTSPADADPRVESRSSGTSHSRVVYAAIALSGFTALAGEVIWTRLLALLFGATVYTFSIVLAIFLLGLGTGSALGALAARSANNPQRLLGWCQLLLVGAIAWTAYVVARVLPYWPIITSASPAVRYTFEINFASGLLAITPGPLLWGASFPLAVAAAGANRLHAPRMVGAVYAANTIGAIAGSLLTGLVLVPWLGSQHVQQVMMIAAAYSGLLLLLNGERRAALAPAVVMAVWAIVTVPAIPDVLVAYGKYAVTWVGHTGQMLYVGEGLNATIAVSRLPNGMLNYHNAGKIQASSQPQDMRLQRLLGHASTLLADRPARTLVIGCGSGITAGAVSIDPRVDSELIVEIERLVPEAVSTYFGEQNFNVISNPKVRLRIDDARHYLVTTTDTFDVITADPFDPWVRGAATLYTTEFFRIAKAHLNPGGLITMWVPLYTTTPEAVKTQLATFFSVFPDAFILANTRDGKGYDVILIGQHTPTPIDVDALDARLRRVEFSPVAKSLSDVGIASATDLLANFTASARDLTPWLAGAPLNRDGDLRLQYLAGLGIDVERPDMIYAEMVRHRTAPRDLFSGSPESVTHLLSAMR